LDRRGGDLLPNSLGSCLRFSLGRAFHDLAVPFPLVPPLHHPDGLAGAVLCASNQHVSFTPNWRSNCACDRWLYPPGMVGAIATGRSHLPILVALPHLSPFAPSATRNSTVLSGRLAKVSTTARRTCRR